MALNFRSAVRQTAFVGAVIGASILGGFSAAAGEYNGSAACAKIKDGIAGVKCEITEVDRRTEDAKKRGAEAISVVDCVRYLKAGDESGTIPKAEALARGGGKLTKENACDIAKYYGFGRKAEGTGPRVN